MSNVILATKLRNALRATVPSATVKFSNISINGVKQGCSGFVTDPATGNVVYVSTDVNHGTTTKALVRTARDTKDYRGGRNTFTPLDPHDIAVRVRELLEER